MLSKLLPVMVLASPLPMPLALRRIDQRQVLDRDQAARRRAMTVDRRGDECRCRAAGRSRCLCRSPDIGVVAGVRRSACPCRAPPLSMSLPAPPLSVSWPAPPFEPVVPPPPSRVSLPASPSDDILDTVAGHPMAACLTVLRELFDVARWQRALYLRERVAHFVDALVQHLGDGYRSVPSTA